VVGFAKRKCLFVRNEMACAKTLYNNLHQNILAFKAIDLSLILRRLRRRAYSRKHKRELGKFIDLSDESINSRNEFGHGELDTVRGIKNKSDEVIVSLLERKSRLYVALRCSSAKSENVKETLGT